MHYHRVDLSGPAAAVDAVVAELTTVGAKRIDGTGNG